MKEISIAKLVNMIDSGIIYITDSQRAIAPVASIAQNMMFPLRTTTTKNTLTTPEFKDRVGSVFGPDMTHLAKFDGKYYVLSDASEFMTAYNFVKGQAINDGYVARSPKMVSYFKRISKGKKRMTYANIPASMQKKLLRLSLSCDIVEASSMDEIIALRKTYLGKRASVDDKIVMANEYTTFYSMFNDLAHAIRWNKGKNADELPEFFDDLSTEAQKAFMLITQNIGKTRLSESGVRRLLLLSIDAANFNFRKDQSGAVATFDFICSKHMADSKAHCIDIINNVLLNLSVAPKFLDDARLSHPMLWIGCVYTFGQYSKISYIKKADRHALTRLTDAKIRSKRAKFNEYIEDCLTGVKTTFEGSNIVISNDANGPGMVFNYRTVDNDLHDVSNLFITASVIQAIYNEI